MGCGRSRRLWVCAFWVSFASTASATEPLASRIEALLKSPGFEAGHWGIYVVDAKSGEPVYERNIDELFAGVGDQSFHHSGRVRGSSGLTIALRRRWCDMAKSSQVFCTAI